MFIKKTDITGYFPQSVAVFSGNRVPKRQSLKIWTVGFGPPIFSIFERLLFSKLQSECNRNVGFFHTLYKTLCHICHIKKTYCSLSVLNHQSKMTETVNTKVCVEYNKHIVQIYLSIPQLYLVLFSDILHRSFYQDYWRAITSFNI